jgi:replicative DNA helicase
MFLYRDEVYKQDSTDPALKGMAELIIAKHRAGPIATIRLVFQGEFTLFRSAARGVSTQVEEEI